MAILLVLIFTLVFIYISIKYNECVELLFDEEIEDFETNKQF